LSREKISLDNIAGEDVKERTRIAAWAYIVVSAMGVLQITSIPASKLTFPYIGFRVASEWAVLLNSWIVYLLLLIGWTDLLKSRNWAWGLLVVLSLYGMFADCRLMFDPPALLYWLDGIPWIGIMSMLPLWLLLTDRPSGWDGSRQAGVVSSEH